MRLLKALLMATAIIMMSQAAMAGFGGICVVSGTTTTCTLATNTYYRVGEDTSDVNDMVYVCAFIAASDEWERVGWADYDDEDTLIIVGSALDEEITMAETMSTNDVCDYGGSLYVKAFPSDWFEEAIIVEGGEGDDDIYGSYRGEYLYGDGDDDLIEGNDGEDFIYGVGGVDYLYGGDDIDYIEGGSENDTIEGNECGDYLYGDTGNDYVYGNEGDDYIEGNGGRDHLYGDAGGDEIWGGLATDWLYGGDGDDFLYGEDGAADLCDGGDDTDYCDIWPSCDFFNDCE